MADTFVFQPAYGPDGLIVRRCGEIDMATVFPVREYLLGLDDPLVTLDFCDVTFMDTTGVKLLVVLQGRIRARGGKLVLYGVQSNQIRVLDVLGLSDYFDCMVPE